MYDLVILKEKEMSGGNERKKVERLGGKEKVNEDQFSSVTQSYPTLWDPMDHNTPGFPVHYQLPELTQTHVHPTISSSVVPFSSCQHQGLFQWVSSSHSGGQSTGVSASASVPPINIQDWFPLGWSGWISLQSKGLSRVFSNTTVQKHQFFGAQLSL